MCLSNSIKPTDPMKLNSIVMDNIKPIDSRKDLPLISKNLPLIKNVGSENSISKSARDLPIASVKKGGLNLNVFSEKSQTLLFDEKGLTKNQIIEALAKNKIKLERPMDDISLYNNVANKKFTIIGVVIDPSNSNNLMYDVGFIYKFLGKTQVEFVAGIPDANNINFPWNKGQSIWDDNTVYWGVIRKFCGSNPIYMVGPKYIVVKYK